MIAPISSRLFNRKSVQTALRAVDHAVKTIKIPKNGLIIFASDDQLEIREPPTPAQKSIYLCDSVFHHEFWDELDPTNIRILGHIVVITGNGFDIYSVASNDRISILYEEKVELAKNHGRGGVEFLLC